MEPIDPSLRISCLKNVHGKECGLFKKLTAEKILIYNEIVLLKSNSILALHCPVQ